MRVDMLTREYPPHVYGGAGVHVTELVRALRDTHEVKVRVLGQASGSAGATDYPAPPGLHGTNPALRFMGAGLAAAADCAGADVVHSHTWYAATAGRLAAALHGVPHIMTLHSLEPLRPWKAEQLGGGYALSSWMERDAVNSADALVAVSYAMRDDILKAYPDVAPERLHVIHNGIDTLRWRPDHGTDALQRYGIDRFRPIVLFVGRVTRQKGLHHLLRAAAMLRGDAQLVLCCGQPDTPEFGAEIDAAFAELTRARRGVIRVDGMLDQTSLLQLLTHATVFVCPSLYEPMGIVNLEAMAAQTAVVATRVGGIPEVVAHGDTGLLVPYRARDVSGEPADPDRLAADLAAAVNSLLDDPDRALEWGRAGRRRAREEFSWQRIAERTAEVYRATLGTAGAVGVSGASGFSGAGVTGDVTVN